jgi:hypothetical protein
MSDLPEILFSSFFAIALANTAPKMSVLFFHPDLTAGRAVE